ncbi:hypothetical protein AJ80_01626 [Polytolypa hystricis UAMH7299]|uniref:HMG box domain-containing protein n=1 Tax=Polytolypa hystricis (strain UAMH7299) TaxID=1447883 RepID=A0A2B7YZU5_POLH7|nr:hypothetical protein AJ80_01626 [Polytolypa hystricis UAMH7299]
MATTAIGSMGSMPGSLDLVVELIWQHGLKDLKNTKNEILLPIDITSLIGHDNVDKIKDRLSETLKAPVVAFEDSVNRVYRIMPTPALENAFDAALANALPIAEEEQSSNYGSNSNKQITQGKAGKIPRPPNAFILYRQHHHPLVKVAHPEFHNNDISVLLGKKWKAEPAETKAHFKALADEIKRKHAEDHPDYQYAPRKPSEKKRRSTTRRHSQSTGLSNGQVAVGDAATPASQSDTAYESAFSPATDNGLSINENHHFEQTVPASVSQDITNVMFGASSNFVLGVDEAGFMTFDRRRFPTVATPPAPALSSAVNNITIAPQPQMPANPITTTPWNNLDYDFDHYFLEL